MGIHTNYDYSFLFSGLSGGGTSQNTGNLFSSVNLADYASIQNGSYYSLTKAYYNKQATEESSESSDKKSGSASKLSSNANVAATADSLKDSADALIKTGNDSVFSKKNVTTKNEDGTSTTSYGYDVNAIYKAVKSFTDSYNSVVTAGGNSSNNRILRETLNMTKNTKVYSPLLKQVGITIGSDNKLTLDEETFKDSNMDKVKNLFNGNNSFAYTTSAKASQLDYYAETANGIYNFSGSFSGTSSQGSLFNTSF